LTAMVAVYYPRRRLSSPDTARGFQARTSDHGQAQPYHQLMAGRFIFSAIMRRFWVVTRR